MTQPAPIMTPSTPSTSSTPSKIVRTARALFANKGFEGVSISQIGAELGLTKQAVLHHFGTKEALYGEVLQQICEELHAIRQHTAQPGASPQQTANSYFLSLTARTPAAIERTRLLMRELLDNHRRALKAQKWYLADFLEELIWMIGAIPNWRKASRAQALALVYQLLGAIHYYAISGPTLSAIFGEADYKAIDACFTPQLAVLIDAAIARGPVKPEALSPETVSPEALT